MTIYEMAEARRAVWLAEHPGGHEWEKHDLPTEAQEELANCWNYLQAEVGRLDGRRHQEESMLLLIHTLTLLPRAFDTIESYKETLK